MVVSRRSFIQNTSTFLAGASMLPPPDFIFENPRLSSMPYVTPESTGVLSEAINAYLQAANDSGLEHHGFIMARHGKIIAEAYWKPFAADHIHTLYSLSKSFTGTAVGLAIQEGYFKLTDKVYSFFPEHLPAALSDNLLNMEVRHALNMATGHVNDTMGPMRAGGTTSWVKTFLEQPVEKAPGTYFLYNTGSTYVCGAIVSKLTGMPIQEYLKTRLYQPLGITQSDWEVSPEGYNCGGYGLRVTTRDIIRFGQLYLNEGQLNGKQLLNQTYIHEATTSHIQSKPIGGDWGEGYGYQFWRCRHNFYRGDGAFGQYCIVMPEHNAVIAINSESSNMQKQMELIWEHLLPGIKSETLSKNKLAYKELLSTAAGLELNANLGSNGFDKFGSEKNIQLNENEWGWQNMKIKSGKDGGTLTLLKGNQSLHIPFGWNTWKSNNSRINNPFSADYRSMVPSQVYTSAGTVGDELKIRLKYTEAIHGDLLTVIQGGNNSVEIKFLHSLVEKKANNAIENRKTIQGKLI
ncbi:MAG: serine hydrolase [Saprospiraceae bacterium]